MKTIILAGGFGTRLSEYTESIPKPMVTIGGIPIIWHIMNSYVNYGHKEFFLALGYKANIVKQYFREIKRKFGEIDILINNAAFTTEMALKDFNIKNKDYFSTKIWDQTINTNLKGSFLACKYFIKYHHNKKKDQRVINVGTIYGLHGPHHKNYDDQKFFSSISYSSSKAGLVGMTRWLATKYALENTAFNLISPGGVYNNHNNKFLKNYTNMIPKRKMANEKQIYSAIEFLISRNADYVIGQDIFVDGGFSAW